VDRANQADALRAHGADVVLQDMAEASVVAPKMPVCALEALAQIGDALGDKHLALFLDYDGTLTPIVERPELAVLADDVRAILRRLSRHCTLSVISGRDLQDVRERVGVESLGYAGSHGFDILAPGAAVPAPPEAAAAVPELDAAEALLRKRLALLQGVLLERKRFGLAVHYRMADPAQEGAVEAAVDAALERFRRLRKTRGKKVFELLPAIDWHKGSALKRLRDSLGMRRADTLSMYIGDDVTDEDAFKVLDASDIGIVVMDVPRATAARYRLSDTQQVARFLAALADQLEQ
jgi:alpha,alpha-trehalase